MKNFIILFEEKEGTSAIVRYLNNFPKVSIVRQIEKNGWEPFDIHQAGEISLSTLVACLNMVFDNSRDRFDELNKIYLQKSNRPLERFDQQNNAVGFKMRFRPTGSSFGAFQIPVAQIHALYQRMMIKTFKENDVIVFLMVRQDTLRWALSKYHGDGTGKRGHLQFKLASGKIKRSEIPNIQINLERFGELIEECNSSYIKKMKLMEMLLQSRLKVYPLLYEEFLESKANFFREFMTRINMKITIEQLEHSIKEGCYFTKVHSTNISDFVDNYEEVLEKFGDSYFKWSLR